MPSLYANRGAKRAREARADLGFDRSGPLPDVLEAIEGGNGPHAVLLELPERVAGAHVARAGRPLLLVNGRQAMTRQRFTLAHEFGHHRMGHSTVVDEQDAISDYARDPKEVAANAFAAEFLVPRDAVTAWAQENVRGTVTLEHVVTLACGYGVSAQAARYALETAKVLDRRSRCDQLDREIAEGLHVEVARQLALEPLQDGLADAAKRLPRIPAALRETALGDLLAGEIDAAGLAERIGREPREVERMLADLGLDRVLPAAF